MYLKCIQRTHQDTIKIHQDTYVHVSDRKLYPHLIGAHRLISITATASYRVALLNTPRRSSRIPPLHTTLSWKSLLVLHKIRRTDEHLRLLLIPIPAPPHPLHRITARRPQGCARLSRRAADCLVAPQPPSPVQPCALFSLSPTRVSTTAVQAVAARSAISLRSLHEL